MRNCRLEHAALIADRLAGLKTYAATLYLLLRYPQARASSPRGIATNILRFANCQ